MTNNLKTLPERIHLQHFEDDQIQDYQGSEDISWCVDRIYGSDVEYVRADLVQQPAQAVPFQNRVEPWMMECFGAEIASDRQERNHRFFEEATETGQANGMTRVEAHQLVDYTFDRPVGELNQEIGGVMVTLAALCLASGVDMHAAGETELARIWTKVDQIRAKQAAKPKHSPLPAEPVPLSDAHLLEWLNEQVVDVIYLDDGTLIDVRGNDVRTAIRAIIAATKEPS